MGWIIGIEIEYNKGDDCYRYRFEELKDGEKQTVLSRQFSHWADCVELLHDKIMRWGEDNPTVADWNGKAADRRFDLTDYYLGEQ